MKKGLCLLFAIFAILLSIYVPNNFVSSIHNCKYFIPKEIVYQDNISVSGIISESNKKEIYINAPYIPSKVYFNVGDIVKKGDKIADINTELTKSVLEGGINVTKQVPEFDEKSVEGILGNIDKFGVSLDNFDEIKKYANKIVAVNKISDITIPTSINASMSGVITEINMYEDVLSNQSDPVVKISDLSNLFVIAKVNEDDINKVELGDNAVISGVGFPSKKYNGKVTKIYPIAKKQIATTQTSSVDVEIEIENPDNKIKSGFSAQVDIMTGKPKNINIIPYDAIIQDKNNIEYVYVFDNGKAKRKNILTGEEMANFVQIKDGISPNNYILITNNNLHDGDYVKVMGEFKNEH